MSEEEIVNYPVVVIVGRPNVGKSTWFNRVIGEQAAIVEDRPGITRDRHRRMAAWLGVDFWIVDTGGWMPSGSELDDKVSRQVEEAVREADLVIFMVDAAIGVTDEDEMIAVANKSAGSSCLSVLVSLCRYLRCMVVVQVIS
jgi:GTP-binding protein